MYWKQIGKYEKCPQNWVVDAWQWAWEISSFECFERFETSYNEKGSGTSKKNRLLISTKALVLMKHLKKAYLKKLFSKKVEVFLNFVIS